MAARTILIAALPALLALGAPAAATPGETLLARYECSRCHDGIPAPAPAPEKACTGCHRDIIGGSFDAPERQLAAWRKNLVSLRQAPSLAGVGQRLQRGWLREFLLRPHDLRPALAASMPRLPITPADADALAAALVPAEVPPRPSGGDLEAGRALYQRFACATCHAFTGAGLREPKRPAVVARGRGDAAPPDGVALAPDLAGTRARFQNGRLVAWLRDPQALLPGTTMPGLPDASAADLESLARFLLEAPLASRTPVAPPPRLPLLRRGVRYDEVEKRVLRKVCWHCHAQPDFARGDGGPGNTGGFGFPARGLDLSSYSGAAAGFDDNRGERRSIFQPLAPGQAPLLVQALLARQQEEHGAADPALRGMPLGFPALTPVEIQLVESWVAQGRPP